MIYKYCIDYKLKLYTLENYTLDYILELKRITLNIKHQYLCTSFLECLNYIYKIDFFYLSILLSNFEIVTITLNINNHD